MKATLNNSTIEMIWFATNVSRASARNPVLRLRQGYGACELLVAGGFLKMFFYFN